MDLKEQRAIGGDPKRHWYYISKARAIKALIGPEPVEALLDVGAGSGVFSRLLIEDGAAGRAVCVDPAYEDEWIGSRRTDRISFLRTIERAGVPLVLMIDVIGEADDDVALIRDYAARADEGTRFVISVPAFDSLWSPQKDVPGHRRYTLETLQAAVEAAGLEPLKMRYFFGMLLPAAAALRLAGRAMSGDSGASESALKAAPDWLNAALVAVHDIERLALFPLNKVAGVSAFCLAEKPAAVARKTAAA